MLFGELGCLVSYLGLSHWLAERRGDRNGARGMDRAVSTSLTPGATGMRSRMDMWTVHVPCLAKALHDGTLGSVNMEPDRGSL